MARIASDAIYGGDEDVVAPVQTHNRRATISRRYGQEARNRVNRDRNPKSAFNSVPEFRCGHWLVRRTQDLDNRGLNNAHPRSEPWTLSINALRVAGFGRLQSGVDGRLKTTNRSLIRQGAC